MGRTSNASYALYEHAMYNYDATTIDSKGVNSFEVIYRIVQNFDGVKLWRIDRFRVLVGENVGEFAIANIATLVNLEFGEVKYWRMVFGSPNPPIFSSAKKLRYTVVHFIFKMPIAKLVE